MIPNTTQVPNILFNGEMQKMKDTELRIVLIVTRKTLGWIENPDTGMRKEEDWISRKQLIQLTGRRKRAVQEAITNCIKNGWIEARDEHGRILKTSRDREKIGRGGKIFYRLGRVFLSQIKGGKNDPLFEEKGSKKKGAKKAPQKMPPTKETYIQKKTIYKYNNITKVSKKVFPFTGKEINELINKFKFVNPNYELLFKNKTQRKAMERLTGKFGVEEIGKLLDALPQIVTRKYAPRITTPLQLEKKLGELLIFLKQEKQKARKGRKIGIVI